MKYFIGSVIVFTVLCIPSANSAGIDSKKMMRCYQMYASPIYMKACLVL